MHEWSSLVRPAMRVPDYIVRLTGISSEMVTDAVTFEDIAEEVLERLEGRVFVAHNAHGLVGHQRERNTGAPGARAQA